MRLLSHRLGFVAIASCALLAASCGEGSRTLPETGATLEGTVSYGGEQLEFALIVVQTAEGSATGKIGEDKRYRVENVPLGEVMIGVNTSAARGDFQSKVMAASQGKPKSMPKFTDVPAKYFDPEKSGIKTTVQKGVNPYDITIPRLKGE
jgi:hypothetical protein